MKKAYQNPEILLCTIANEDILTASELAVYDKGGVSRGEDVIMW